MQTQPNCNEGIFQLQTCEWSYHAIRLLSKNSIFREGYSTTTKSEAM